MGVDVLSMNKLEYNIDMVGVKIVQCGIVVVNDRCPQQVCTTIWSCGVSCELCALFHIFHEAVDMEATDDGMCTMCQ